MQDGLEEVAALGLGAFDRRVYVPLSPVANSIMVVLAALSSEATIQNALVAKGLGIVPVARTECPVRLQVLMNDGYHAERSIQIHKDLASGASGKKGLGWGRMGVSLQLRCQFVPAQFFFVASLGEELPNILRWNDPYR